MRDDVARKAESLIGQEFETNSYGKCFIIDYKGIYDVTVMFYEPMSIVKCVFQNLKAGRVKNPLLPTVYGKGYIGVGAYSTSNTKIYKMWVRMLERCYDEKYHNKYPTYKDVEVCDEWLNFQNFAGWCESKHHFHLKDANERSYQLDKDILVKGNKVYSPETCCFIPSEINLLILNNGKCRGKHPVGVYFNRPRKKYIANLNCRKSQKHLGMFRTPEEAFRAYKQAKESYVKEVANKWKGSISSETYQALMKWEVNIDD